VTLPGQMLFTLAVETTPDFFILFEQRWGLHIINETFENCLPLQHSPPLSGC
jgi:hypothetical protein